MESIWRLQPSVTSNIQQWIDQGKMYQEITDMLKVEFQDVTRGLSPRSWRHFCEDHRIRKHKGMELDRVVHKCILMVSRNTIDLSLASQTLEVWLYRSMCTCTSYRLNNAAHLCPTLNSLTPFSHRCSGWTLVWKKVNERAPSCKRNQSF